MPLEEAVAVAAMLALEPAEAEMPEAEAEPERTADILELKEAVELRVRQEDTEG